MRIRTAGIDIALVLLVALLALRVTVSTLDGWHGPAHTLTNELYVPAAMWASGQGWINPPLNEVPGLREFLYFQTDSFAFQGESREYSTTEWDAFQQYHVYLVSLMGIFWRLFGLEWETAKLTIAFILGLSAIGVYGIFRMVTGRAIAFVGTAAFLYHPAILSNLYNLRDLSKAPYIIGGVLVLAWLLRSPRNPRAYFLTAVVFGLVAGIGIGFRRDLLMVLPAGMLALALCETIRVRAWQRGVAIALMLAVFATISWPVMQAFQRHGSLGAHDSIMGFAAVHDYTMGLAPAAYDRFPVRRDPATSSYTSAWMSGFRPEFERPMTFGEPEKRAFLVATIKAFPADMLIRGYAGALTITRGVFQSHSDASGVSQSIGGTWQDLLARSGLPWAAGALILLGIAGRRPRTALLLLLLLIYYGGYPSMQFDSRHVLHLLFVPLLIVGWTLDVVIRAGWRRFRADEPDAKVEGGAPWQPRNAALFAAAGIGLVLVPLFVARTVQIYTVGGIRDAYASAETAPVTAAVEVEGHWTFVRPTLAEHYTAPPPLHATGATRHGMLVAEFEDPPPGAFLWVRYEAREGGGDYSRTFILDPDESADGGRIRFYFPAFSMYRDLYWFRFDHLALPEELAPSFRGVSRVTNPETLRIPLTMSVTEGRFIPYQRLHGLRPYPFPSPASQAIPNDPIQVRMEARHRVDRGDLDGAIEIARAGLLDTPGNRELRMSLALTLWQRGDIAEAGEIWEAMIEDFPDDPLIASQYNLIFEDETDPVRLSFWQDAIVRDPGNPYFRFWLARSHEYAGNSAEAADLYFSLLDERPGDWTLIQSLTQLLRNESDWEGLLRAALHIDPPVMFYHHHFLWLVISESNLREPADIRLARWQAYTAAHPERPVGWFMHAEAQVASGDIAGAIESLHEGLRTVGDDWPPLRMNIENRLEELKRHP